MSNNPIYVVDDDEDDEYMLREVMKDLGVKNELRFFYTAEGLLKTLREENVVPFLILSDVNLPRMNGFDLRRQIMEDPLILDKTVPFIFWSNSASDSQVKLAYDLSAHGFFLKGKTFHELKEEMDEILRYWNKSLSPHGT
jgi:CheY-like chemotaxis protein